MQTRSGVLRTAFLWVWVVACPNGTSWASSASGTTSFLDDGTILSRSPPLVATERTDWSEEERPAAKHPFFGVTVDAGFPDGVAAGLLVMPLSLLRIHLAVLTNGLGVGARLGATLVGFPTWVVRPTLGVDGGYTFGGVVPWLLGYVGDEMLKTALAKVSVGFVTARGGFELGSKNVALTVQGGVSWIDVNLGAQTADLGGGVSVKATGSSVRGFVPSVRLGLLFCFG